MGAPLRQWTFSIDTGSDAGNEADRLLRALGAMVEPAGPRAAPVDGTAGPRAAPVDGTAGPRAAPVDGTVVAAGRRAAPTPGAPGGPGNAAHGVVVELWGPTPAAAGWAASGAMWLTGHPSGPPLVPGPGIAASLQGAAAVLELLTAVLGRRVRVDGPALLGERAAMGGLSRQGRTSAGGSSRLIPCADGWLAVNLARPADIELLPAWLVCSDTLPPDPWAVVERAAATASAGALADRGQLLGIPVAAVPQPGEAAADAQSAARGQTLPLAPFLIDAGGPRPVAHRRRPSGRWAPSPTPDARPPLVLDLTSLWAGPLCAHLLGLAGARVIKVEASRRPDAARVGLPAFFDLLHAGHESVALDLTHPDGVAALHRVAAAADVIVEGSRPRALAQLGLRPEEVLAGRPSATWVSITGYGRSGPWSDRVAFGDDAAAAAGLVAVAEDGPVFCGDAIADPVAGLYAAIGAVASLLDGGGHLVDVALRDAAGHLCGAVARRPAANRPSRSRPDGSWAVDVAGTDWLVAPPRHRPPPGVAAPLGFHTRSVLAELRRAR